MLELEQGCAATSLKLQHGGVWKITGPLLPTDGAVLGTQQHHVRKVTWVRLGTDEAPLGIILGSKNGPEMDPETVPQNGPEMVPKMDPKRAP